MSFAINPYVFAPVNLIQNGDFSDISGMGVTGGGWYNNTPPFWLTDSVSRNNGFSVLLLSGKYYANLQTLSEPISGGVFKPLYQQRMSAPIPLTLTATWTITSLNGANYALGAAFYSGNSFDNAVAVYNSGVTSATITASLVVNNLPANTIVRLAFWQAVSSAPGITDITVYASQP